MRIKLFHNTLKINNFHNTVQNNASFKKKKKNLRSTSRYTNTNIDVIEIKKITVLFFKKKLNT